MRTLNIYLNLTETVTRYLKFGLNGTRYEEKHQYDKDREDKRENEDNSKYHYPIEGEVLVQVGKLCNLRGVTTNYAKCPVERKRRISIVIVRRAFYYREENNSNLENYRVGAINKVLSTKETNSSLRISLWHSN